jgi:hypothetical protein
MDPNRCVVGFGKLRFERERVAVVLKEREREAERDARGIRVVQVS